MSKVEQVSDGIEPEVEGKVNLDSGKVRASKLIFVREIAAKGGVMRVLRPTVTVKPLADVIGVGQTSPTSRPRQFQVLRRGPHLTGSSMQALTAIRDELGAKRSTGALEALLKMSEDDRERVINGAAKRLAERRSVSRVARLILQSMLRDIRSPLVAALHAAEKRQGNEQSIISEKHKRRSRSIKLRGGTAGGKVIIPTGSESG